MQTIDCVQGSDEWWQARIGVPTASEFDKILTPAKLELSQSSKGYRNKLLGEWLRGKPDEGFQSEWMKHGQDEEGYARSAYLFLTDNPVKQAGFCLTDDGKYGCSPDGLIGDDGGLECKSPSPGVHVGYLLDGKVPTTYRLQIFGSLLVTGRDYWDFISYHADMEPLIVRTWRKDVETELEKLASALDKFCADLDKCKQQLADKGYVEAS